MNKNEFKDCRISIKNNSYTIENSKVKRIFSCKNGFFHTISFFNKTAKTEWVSAQGTENDFSYEGLLTEYSGAPLKLKVLKANAVTEKNNIFQKDSLSLLITLFEEKQQITITRKYTVYSEIAAIAVKTLIKTPVVPNFYSKIEFGHNIKMKPCINTIDAIETSKISTGKIVSLFGRTDLSNELIEEKNCKFNIKKDFEATGNMLFAVDKKASGFFLVQEAPPAGEKRNESEHDFILKNGKLKNLGWGILPSEFKDTEMQAYTSVIGVFSGSMENGETEFKKYFAARFKTTEKNFKSMSNPWGGGGEIWQKNISEKFILDEISACEEMGVSMYQVDDGWQENRSLGELTTRNKPQTNAAWAIRKDLFPTGFKKIKDACDRKNVELCLWFAPSMNKMYRDWEEQVELLYGFYKKFGIKTFKIDGVVVTCKEAEENLEKLLRTLRKKTNGDIYFNLDTTSGMRPGYLLFQEYGNVFLENRYQGEPGLRRYEPWRTLRNFWKLAKYIPAQRMQVEFMDVEAAKKNFRKNYTGLPYPEKFTQEFVTATTLFSSPLCWAYPSRFSNEAKKSVRKIMDLQKKISGELFDSTVIPVGDEPSGKAWTGFQAHNAEKGTGLLIVYRETSKDHTKNIHLDNLKGRIAVFERIDEEDEKITVDFTKRPSIEIELDTMNSFKLYRYKLLK